MSRIWLLQNIKSRHRGIFKKTDQNCSILLQNELKDFKKMIHDMKECITKVKTQKWGNRSQEKLEFFNHEN